MNQKKKDQPLPPPLPKEKFNVILTDPPWQFFYLPPQKILI